MCGGGHADREDATPRAYTLWRTARAQGLTRCLFGRGRYPIRPAQVSRRANNEMQ